MVLQKDIMSYSDASNIFPRNLQLTHACKMYNGIQSKNMKLFDKGDKFATKFQFHRIKRLQY